MPGVFSNPLSVAPRIFALSLMLGEVAWAASQGDGPVRVEVFTGHDLPIQAVRGADSPSASMTIEVYALDGIERFEATLSERLPTDRNAARRAAIARIPPPDSAEVDQVARAAVGLVRAAEYGIDRYPAIVFDGHAVVYGVTDIGEALRHYRVWQGRALR
jgi:integrating conjugative element protein (TIGR03757 family)